MKRFFLLSVFLPLAATLAAQAERQIHVFGIFCDAYQGDAGLINSGVSADRVRIDTIFTEYFSEQSWGVKLRREFVEGELSTKANILERFEQFVTGVSEEDTIYVHYSGHGVILNPADGKQFFHTIDEEYVSRDDIAQTLENLPCKLRILITDCCSSYPPEFTIAEGDEEVEPWRNLYSLLLEHEGFVNITAASPGEPAYGTEYGGFLTINLESDVQRFRSWKQVFDSTQARVYEETAEQIRAAGADDMPPQRPVAYSLGTPVFDQNDPNPPKISEFVLPESDSRYLTYNELANMGLQQLYLARNEIFARYGYDFNSDFLRNYFSSLSWYHRQPGFKSPPLTDVEKHNSELILKVETDLGGPFIAGNKVMPGDAGNNAAPDIFAYSSDRALTRAVLQNLTPAELSIARNEIYARHGYPFSSPVLQNYFSQKPYYRRSGFTGEPNFNEVEKHNLWLIRKVERINGGAYQW